MKHVLIISGIVAIGLCLSGCNGKKEDSSPTTNGMKCGAGKCGANMADGGTLLDKKRMNLLSQMREDDTRRRCVEEAMSAKAMYACVTDVRTGRMSIKCDAAYSAGMQKSLPKPSDAAMKCEAGKCGG